MAFGPVDPQLDLPALEARTAARWRDGDVVGAVARLRKDGEPWIFYEGPPTANGRPGLHHVWARVYKDLFPRFQTMRGRRVPRKGGWDCHGLPVELEVEKELGLATKQDIEAYGIAEFNERCRASVKRYVEDWTALTDRSGTWIDTADAYWTLDNTYVESVWWLVKSMWDKGLLYEGHRVSPYCPRCGTALSSHEVAQGYQDVVDPSIYVRFPVRGRPDDDPIDLLVWTTTPWTLLSNVGVAIGPDITYVRVRSNDDRPDLVMAEAAAARRYPDAAVVERFGAADLAGWRYERPFTLLDVDERGARVVCADYVSVEDGSGLVHLAPAFGEDDAAVGRAEDLPVLNPVGPDGTFGPEITPWAGLFVKDADRSIIDDLDGRGRLEAEEAYEHAYPHCWRCGTPLLYWAKTSWFARTSERRPDLLRENETIGWHPDHLKHGRFGKWLEGNVDWALSRDRYWGTPLPVWRCEAGHDTCVGSVAELADLAGRDLTELDLHRPYVDEVTFACPADGCGEPATRLAPVLDAWFDSGSMPSAQHHFPFAHADQFSDAFPADFICEAIDQTRGWFYSLLAVNTLVFDQTPYRNVVCLGHIVDENGAKMSKSKGNVVDPWDLFDRFGADSVRWYFFAAGQPWTPRRVFEDGIREATRQTLVTLWNVHSFFVTYADLDGWSPSASSASTDATASTEPTADGLPAAPEHVLDRWVLSELDDTIATVTDALEGFDALSGATRIIRFVDDLSNWYVRRSRSRFWKSSDPAAHATLHRCLTVVSQLLAPYCPFLADELYTTLTGSLTGGESVHLSDWPSPAGRHDPALTVSMAGARRLVALGRAARTDAKMKVRQPLRRALLLAPGVTLDDDVLAEVATELNVKELEAIDTLSGLMSWTVIPNFKALGPRLGARVNDVKAALASADGGAVKAALDTDGSVVVAGETLTADDVEVRANRHDEFALAEEAGWAVALDLDLDDALRLEGTAREVVRALNDLRKEAGFAIADRVTISLDPPPALAEAVTAHQAWIAGEVLATDLRLAPGGAHELTVDNHTFPVTITHS